MKQHRKQRTCRPVTRARAWALVGLSAALLVLACLASLCAGASGLTAGEALRALFGQESTARSIVLYVRLPRLLAALMAGGALALSGVLLQEVLMNSLAAPSVIGVNAGAGLFALCAMAFLPGTPSLTPLMAFLGALAAAGLSYALSRLAGLGRASIVLAGVAVSSLFGACTDMIVTFVPDAVNSRSAFSIGGFANVSMQKLGLALPVCLLGAALAFIFRRELTLISLGDEMASGLGLRVERFRLIFLAAAALLAGGAVSFAGLLGFVGLITPHMARALLRERREYLPALSVLLGALLSVLADLAARTLFAPYELPVGVVLSFAGAPFFLYLLIRGRGRAER